MLVGKIIGYFPVAVQKPVFKMGYFLISIIFYHFRNGKKKDVFLFSTRRSGSTLLGQIFSANNGVRNIDQPLSTHSPPGVAGALRGTVVERYLPEKPFSQYASLSKDESIMITDYINLMVRGKIHLNAWLEYKASRKKLFCYTDRVLLKLTDANAIIDWFVDNFNCHAIYLVRHPVANALSIVKNNWGITVSAYLDDDYFCKKYLSNEQIEFGQHILESGNSFQQALLNWCLENIVPLNYSNREFFTLTYEELIMCPDEVIPLLASRFSLNDVDRMVRVSAMPSFSTTLSESSTVKSIINESSAEGKYRNIVNRWNEKISEEDLQKSKDILKMFNINVYTCDSSIPAEQYLHFSSSFMERVPLELREI